MNYLPTGDPKVLSDNNRRKEFYQFAIPAYDPETQRSQLPDGWVRKYNLADLNEEDLALELSSYQTMVGNWLNPNTPYSRLLLKHQPGSGKTISAINIAMQFIHRFERESQMEDPQIGSVFVIGFTEEIFKRDLLSFPKFGFVTREELKQLQALREAAHNENKTDVERLQEFTTRLKKRLGSRKENGYFRFFGYKAFVNRIFMLQDFKRNINDMSEDEIRQSLRDGSLKWNRQLIDSFRNSLVICDEIHNVYNSLEKNNWGVALQMVLDQDPTIKAVFMSATPINNNPTEVVDLANLIQDAQQPKVRKEDFFTGKDGKELRPGALDRIAQIFRGRASFIQDTDPRHFAQQRIVGDEIPGIPYLRFVRCPMTPHHYKTYKQVYTGVLAQDAQYLMDIAFPNPQNTELGLYRTTEIKRALAFADDAWFRKYGFKIQNDIIIGPGLEESRIGEWSAKYAELIHRTRKNLTRHGGKILIYHDVVHVSGVLFIEQLLLHNGFIGIDQNPTEDTLCSVCGVTKKNHETKKRGGDPEAKWSVEAGSTGNAARARALYKRVRGGEFPGEVTPCMTRVMLVGDEAIAVLQMYPEDEGVTRIDALVVSPEHRGEGCEEYLLDNAPPTVLTTVVPEAEADWWLEHGFVEHDRDGSGYVYLHHTPREGRLVEALDAEARNVVTGGVENAPTSVAQLHRGLVAKMLAPRYETKWREYVARLRDPVNVESGDLVVLLLERKGKNIVGYIACNRIDEHNINVFSHGAETAPTVYTDAMTMMLECLIRNAGRVTVWGPHRGHAAARGFATNELAELYTPVGVHGGAKHSAVEKEFDHEFMPARLIVAHSDMDRGVMQKNIDRFNDVDNTWGYNCRVIVGSKIISESFNFKAVQHLKVTARPANISKLIQIFGRARRKKAHSLLPPEFRRIECEIYTSCLPTKEKIKGRVVYALSHEEIKYGEKMLDYQVIQRIEQRIHENAIDAVTARDIILPGLDRRNPGLGALWFEPTAAPRRRYNLKDLNLSTFEIFHSEDEIRLMIYIIKRLYIEYSLCFTYQQLWTTVRAPPFHVEQNCELFQEEYFVIALSKLVYGTTRDPTVRPIARTAGPAARMYLLDILHTDVDKRIMQPDRTVGYIHHIHNLYMFIPFRAGQHDAHPESPFRTFDLHPLRPINVQRYLKESSLTLNYENQKLKFKSKYENVTLERLATVVGKFGVAFHQAFVEEIIKYVFMLWTNPAFTAKSEMHEFYFKMLYYYDLQGLIVWAATAKEFIREMYKAYIMPVSARDAVDNSGEIHSLEMNISRTKQGEILRVSKTEYTNALKRSLEVLHARARKAEKVPIVRADPKVLAIGHFMANVPHFYHPDKDWFESPEYVQRTQEFYENDILVGYYEKSGTGLRVKFKIRTPRHRIEKHRDVRMVEKGSICTSNSKEYLIETAKKLKIKLPDKINVPNLCQAIEERLQLNELEERRKKSNVKWFYAAWEAHEGKRVEQSSTSPDYKGGGDESEYIVPISTMESAM